jgi:integrase
MSIAICDPPRVIDPTRDRYAYERALEALRGDASIQQRNKQLIEAFITKRTSQEIGYSRLATYVKFLRQASLWLDDDFENATREDIERLILLAKQKEEWTSEYTLITFKAVLKKFYQWLRGYEEDYPPEVKWLKTTIKIGSQIIPEDLLTEQEVIALINACPHPRDKAIIAVLYDIGPRPGELLRLRVKDVFIDHSTGVPTVVFTLRGKTGMRRVRGFFSAPYVIQWKKYLPDEPNHPFWPVHEGGGYLRLPGLHKLLKTARKRARMKKRIYPYLFRHTRATIYASVMTEAQMCEYFGWVQGSRMPAVYVHLSGRDVDDRLLEFYNLKKDRKAMEENKPWQCTVCGAVNPAHMDTCYNCMKLRPSSSCSKNVLEVVKQDKEAAENLQKLMARWGLDDPAEALLRLVKEYPIS